MAFDAVAVRCLVKDLKDKLINSRIDKIHQPEKDEIHLLIRAGGTNHRLVLSASASAARAHLSSHAKTGPMEPPMLCMLLRKKLQGAKILEITQPDLERALMLKFDSVNELGDHVELTLAVEIMGRYSNIILVDENGKILKKISVPTEVERGENAIIDNIVDLCGKICDESNIKLSQVEKIGIGVPGTVDSENGMIMFACNLNFNKVSIKPIEEKCGVSVKILNDADAAAYGEYVASGSKADSFICITLGTGIGSGIIINGKIYNGFNGAGGEIGHTTLIKDGVQCSCGRKGCWEKYASATALVSQTKAAIKNNPESIMSKETVINGQTAFRAADKGDETALKVVEKYIEYVAEGLVNVINIFQPKKVVIGGGISREGEPFISRVREFVYKYDYNKYLDKTEITAAELFNDAGIVGAALY